MKTCKNCCYGLITDNRGGVMCAWGGMAYTTCSRFKDKRDCKNKIKDFLRRLIK